MSRFDSLTNVKVYADLNPAYGQSKEPRYRLFFRNADNPSQTHMTDWRYATRKAAERNAAVFQSLYDRYFGGSDHECQ